MPHGPNPRTCPVPCVPVVPIYHGPAPHAGCAWLTSEIPSDAVLTPEQLGDEHRLIAQTAAAFVANEVVPAVPRLEQKDWAVARQLIERAGALGLLGTDVPEALGGVGLDKLSAIIVGEAIGANASFSTTFGAQTGLVIIPLLCFGTPAQQQKYLPRLVTGEIIGAYCLSESGSGSDALGARTKATRLPDGAWSISGEKMWITNGGFADLFVVFAKVDGAALHGVSGRARQRRRLEWSRRAQDGPARLVDDAARPAGRTRAGGPPPRRDRPRSQDRVQRAQLRPLQAGGDVQRWRESRARRSRQLRRRPATVRAADCGVRRHPSQARRNGDSHLRRGKHAVPDHRPHRRRDRRVGRRHRPRSPPRWRSSRSKRRC